MLDDSYLPEKKIAAISLMGKQRVIAISAFRDGVLAVSRMDVLGGRFRDWRQVLSEKVSTYQDAGLSVIIESDNPYFDDAGLRVKLDQVDEVEKRTLQNIALDYYFSMQAMGDNFTDSKGEFRGNIRMSRELQRHWINESSINISQDEKGRNRYDIESDSLTGYHRTLLLSVLGAMHFNQYDESSLSQMMEIFGVVKHKDAVDRMKNVLGGVYGESPQSIQYH